MPWPKPRTRCTEEHDFSSFRAAGCQARHAVRDVTHVAVTTVSGLVSIEIEANAFVQHMVRNIAGSLVRVGRGLERVSWIANVLAQRDRKAAGPTASPDGLYLLEVRYPSDCGLPERTGGSQLPGLPIP